MIENKTGTEVLMQTITSFEEHGEPVAILIVWTDENGCITLRTNSLNHNVIGLAEYAKQSAIRAIFEGD